ncbi:MAG: hypothetical protein QOG43_3303 [Actinomycetota bacterium]|jgi:uncharacterized protein (DUF427 family)|nr:hypothetical protein [Actinomycetota bacterium]
MTLTVGNGPFGHHPTGILNFVPPAHVTLVEPVPRRIRGTKNGTTVVNTERARLVHQSRRLPYYAFPAEDVSVGGAAEPLVEGYVTVPWADLDEWFEEDERVILHPRDPYHRIDTFATSRQVRVSLDGHLVAESTAVRALFETGLPVRYYFPFRDVRLEHLVRSDTVTQCAYKGTAVHWSARLGDTVHPDIAWTYEGDGVQRDAEPVRGRVCFYNERTDIEVDGLRQAQPQTAWSRSAIEEL